MEPSSDPRTISLIVNGEPAEVTVEPRTLLSDALRDELRLTGTHIGCEHGVCGACTIQLDGVPVRSCLLFAVQAEGCAVRTVEDLAEDAGDGTLRLNHLQQAFHEMHGLQCGFCTPGILMSLLPWLADDPDPDEDAIRAALSGNLCRCTGYHNIVRAVQHAIRTARAEK